jgi:NAD(P)-dependent dehydrogenase (short-subunit alcohol dehydrogenase family)
VPDGPVPDGPVARDLAGRVVLVTGGGSGIGAACARLLTARGARVLIADIHPAAAGRVAAGLAGPASASAAPVGPASTAAGGAADGGAAVAVRADVADPTDTERMVATALDAFGRLDGAVNCAGISSKLAVPLAQTPLETWRSVMSVNLDGVFYSMRAELPAIAAAGGGAIVNIASIMGLVGSGRSAAYTAAKHGVVGLTRAAALEYADAGIRVNAVAPGYVDTPFLSPESRRDTAGLGARHPLGRLAAAAEIAEVAVFLISGAASFVTGAVYAADGGYTAR